MAQEDFTGYVETDPGAFLTVTAPKVNAVGYKGSAVTIVYKDKGAAFFTGALKHEWQSTVTSSARLNYPAIWLLGNVIPTTTNLSDFGAALSVSADSSATNLRWDLYSKTLDSFDQYTDVVFASLPVTRYFRATKAGTGVNLSIYSDSNRATLLGTLNVLDNDSYRYLYSFCGGSDSTVVTSTLTSENLNLIFSSTTTPAVALVRIQVNTPTVPSSGNSTTNPLKSLISIVVKTPTVKSLNSSLVAPAVALIRIQSNAPTTKFNSSNTATPTLKTISIIINAPTVSSSSSRVTNPALVSIRIIANSPTIKIINNSLVSPQSTSIRIVVFAPSVNAGGSGVISIQLVLKSQIEKTLSSKSRIDKYLLEESRIETRLTQKSKLLQ